MRDRLLVTAQLALLALLVGLPWLVDGADLTAGWLWPVGSVLAVGGGLVVVAAGLHLGDALTAMPTPRDGAALRTGGLYRWVRHPIYTGVLLLGWGLALRSQLWAGLLLAGLLTGLLHVKARYEEGMLADRHVGYADYRARTPRFVPRPRRR